MQLFARRGRAGTGTQLCVPLTHLPLPGVTQLLSVACQPWGVDQSLQESAVGWEWPTGTGGVGVEAWRRNGGALFT